MTHESWRPPDSEAYRDGRITFDALRTDSATVARAIDAAMRAAPSSWPVLIYGESGVGKELFAQAIHHANPETRKGPYVAVNLAGMSDDLIGSTLYGHVKGAFTGAGADHEGLFAKAAGGTILLDEIGDCPLPQQKTLLQVLASRRFRVVGGDLLALKARILAATHRDLLALSRPPERFRLDLYYRISRVVIELPPVRERSEDILPVFLGLYDAACAQIGRAPEPIDEGTVALLLGYAWPGNFREMENLAAAAATKGLLDAVLESGICAESEADGPPVHRVPFGGDTITDVTLAHVVRLYERYNGDVEQIALAANRQRATIFRLLARARRRGWTPRRPA